MDGVVGEEMDGGVGSSGWWKRGLSGDWRCEDGIAFKVCEVRLRANGK